jgi:hypothetical protein
LSLVGHRTLTFGLVALVALVLGLGLLRIEDRGSAYVFFAGGVASLMVAVAGKSAVGSLAQGGGVKGAAAVLMTDAKPAPPPVPPVVP